MVGFCDLVGVGIAPVSKKTAVKQLCYCYLDNVLHQKKTFVQGFSLDPTKYNVLHSPVDNLNFIYMQTTAYYFAKIGFSSNANVRDHAGGENLCTVQAVQNSVRKFTNFWAITYFIRKKWLDALTLVTDDFL